MGVNPSSCAYMPGDSVMRCASVHVGPTSVIKMDVHDFFHSIDERQVFSVFNSAGYGKLVSLELARVCTSGRAGSWFNLECTAIYGVFISGFEIGRFSPGSTTSGALANVVMNECDEELSDLAVEYGLAYTRYADDLVFSTSDNFSHMSANR